MECVTVDCYLQPFGGGGMVGDPFRGLLCFLCLLVTAVVLASTQRAQEERDRPERRRVESAAACLSFALCAASCTLLTDQSYQKMWLSASSCAASLLILLAQGRRLSTIPKIPSDSPGGQGEEMNQMKWSVKPAAETLLGRLHRKPYHPAEAKPNSFEPTLQVIHEHAAAAAVVVEAANVSLSLSETSEPLSSRKVALILAAVYSLTTQRRKWGKQPDETWGAFLIKLDAILGKSRDAKGPGPSHSSHSRPGPSSAHAVGGAEWYEISAWCSKHPAQELASIVKAAMRLHRSPSEALVWQLARMLDGTLDAPTREGGVSKIDDIDGC